MVTLLRRLHVIRRVSLNLSNLVVTAAQGTPLSIIEDVAKEKNAKLYAFNKDFGIDSRSAVTGVK